MELSEKSRLRDRIKTESIKNKEGLFQISSTVSCSSVLLQKFASILFGYADHLLFIQQIHTRTYLLIRYIQWEFSLAHKRQLPIGDANASSCLVSFWPAVSSHSAENQQVNSGFLCQMSKISALKGKRRKILFFASSSIWRGLKITNFAQGEALKCRQRQCGNIFDCRASKFARRLGQLLWLSSAFVWSVERCGADRRRLPPMRVKVSFVEYMHFPAGQEIAAMLKTGAACNFGGLNTTWVLGTWHSGRKGIGNYYKQLLNANWNSVYIPFIKVQLNLKYCHGMTGMIWNSFVKVMI